MIDRAALEQQIYEGPDDPEGYLVLGDWLETRGDPRGRLIALQSARLMTDSDELRAAEAELIAELGEQAPDGLRLAPDWYLGYWRAVAIGWSHRPATPEDLEEVLALDSARFLRELRVPTAVTQDVLGALGAVQRTLRGLHVWSRERIDDRGLRSVHPLRELRQLTLSSCESVTPRGLEVVRELPHLESIQLYDCTLGDDGAAQLAGSQLAVVHFTRVEGLTARGMQAIAGLPLRSLRLAGDHVDDGAIGPLAGHSTLDNLELAGAPIGPRGASAIATIPNLRRLYLCSSTLGDAAATRLPTSLRALHLGHCEAITDASCEHIARMHELRFLDLSSTQVTAKGLRTLASLRELEHLDLGFLDLSDDDVTHLATFDKLRSLSLAFATRLSDAVIDTIERLPQLQLLDLAAAAISTDAIDRLARMPRLSQLGVHECPWTTIEHAERHKHWYLNRRDTVDFDED